MKKFLCLLTAAILACALLGTVTLSASDIASDDGAFLYSVTSGAATVTRYVGVGGAVVIPATLGGQPVTAIGTDAFAYCEEVTSVSMPDTVVSIGVNAFQYCADLASVDFSDALQTVGANAFYFCESLTAATLPDTVSEIGASAFSGSGLVSFSMPPLVTVLNDGMFNCCAALEQFAFGNVTTAWDSVFLGTALTSVDVPATVETLSGTFSGCRSLTSVTLHEGLKNISGAFLQTSVTAITIPASVTNYGGNDPFQYCTKLSAITIAAGNTVLKVVNGWLYSADGKKLIHCPLTDTATQLAVPEGVETVFVGAFRSNGNLTSITLPATFQSFGTGTNLNQLLYGVPKLQSITIAAGNTSAFSAVDGVLFYTDGSNKYLVGYPSAKTTANYTVANDVTALWTQSIIDNTYLTQITLPAGLISIARGANANGVFAPAFWNCPNLAAITANAANAKYSSADGVLYSKDGKTLVYYPEGKGSEFTVPSGVTTLGGYSFNLLTGLKTLTLPDSVTAISDRAIYGCRNLETVNFGNGLKTIGRLAFVEANSLQAVSLPNTVTSIGQSAFGGAAAMETLTLGNTLDNIGRYAFKDCASLVSVVIPNSVRTIGNQAFASCTSLTTVTMGTGVANMGSGVFYKCTALTTFTMPSTTTGIEDQQFYGCDSLTELNVETVTAPVAFRAVTSAGSIHNVYAARLGLLSALAADLISPAAHITLESNGDAGKLPTSAGGSVITVPSNIQVIGYQAFYGCGGIEKVILSNGVTTIGEEAFLACASLKAVLISDSVTSIAANAFGKNVVLLTHEGSAAYAYAEANGLATGCPATDTTRTVVCVDDCTHQGHWYETCNVCHQVVADVYEPALGHSFTFWSGPVITDDGQFRTRTCTVCGAVETERLEPGSMYYIATPASSAAAVPSSQAAIVSTPTITSKPSAATSSEQQEDLSAPEMGAGGLGTGETLLWTTIALGVVLIGTVVLTRARRKE